MDSLDLGYNEEQDAIRAVVQRFCQQHNVEDVARQCAGPFPRKLWRELAELGVFDAGAAEATEAGGALTVCAISESLGEQLFPGPIPASYAAIQVLADDAAAGVRDGTILVSLSSSGSTLLPWGTEADVFLIASDEQIASAQPPVSIAPVVTLGGETWGRASLKVDAILPNAERAFVVGNISCAAYLAAAGWRLLSDTSTHAATRQQFGKALGEFQAVAHPLADCAIALTAAQTLARAAASHYDGSARGAPDELQQSGHYAAAALLSARRAALSTAYVCHQVFAGIGITLQGPVFHISRRIRQLASTPPGGARERDLLLAAAGLGEQAYDND